MWVDSDGTSHTIALEDGRDRLDAALLRWMEGMSASERLSLEGGLDDLQEGVFDEVTRLPAVPWGREEQELPEDLVVGAGIGRASVSSLLDHLRGIDLAWRMDVIELVMDVAGELPEER
ncbi:hypothetical protein [Oerskovia turbata]